jgi:hypothetical protein
MVPHEFYFLTNVKGHNRRQCLDTMGDAAFTFFSSSLLRQGQGTGTTQRPQPTASVENWDHLPDGSLGRPDEFRGKDGTAIPAYIRKPAEAGPFPVVVLAHGGKYGKATTEGLGRSQRGPTEDFIQAGWAIYSIDCLHLGGVKPSPSGDGFS